MHIVTNDGLVCLLLVSLLMSLYCTYGIIVCVGTGSVQCVVMEVMVNNVVHY